jgi:hypothetical protein
VIDFGDLRALALHRVRDTASHDAA